MNVIGWPTGLEVTADGEGIMSYAGLVVLRLLAGKTGLMAGLSKALVQQPGRSRVLPDLVHHDRRRRRSAIPLCWPVSGSRPAQ